MAMRAVSREATDEIGRVDDRSIESNGALSAVPQQEAMHARTVAVERVGRGDVVAVGQVFYCVDSVVPMHERFGFALIVLRNLESGACAAIEFRNPDARISVLRFQPSCSTGEAVVAREPVRRTRRSERPFH